MTTCLCINTKMLVNEMHDIWACFEVLWEGKCEVRVKAEC